MKYRSDRLRFGRSHQVKREYIALIWDNELDYEFASPQEPMALWELDVVLHERFDEVTSGHCFRIHRIGNQFFLVDEDTGKFLDQWTAVHESELPIWEEVLA